jgi:acetyl esterase/lipase
MSRAHSPHGSRLSRFLGNGLDCLEERLLLSGVFGAPNSESVPALVGSPGQATTLSTVSRWAFLSNKASLHRSPGRGVALSSETAYHDITYATVGGQAEQLDVYLPKGPPPSSGWPVILAIHGGGWRRFDKREYGPRVASAFLSQGYAVVAPDYMLSAPGKPTWPVNLEDVQAAVVWTKLNAARYGLNARRVVAMGESAGANLANLLGTSSPSAASVQGVSAAVSAVISFSSPTDLSTLYAESPPAGKAASQFLGGPPWAVPSSYAAASPVDQVAPGDPPVLLVHGGNDPLVPVSQSEELAAALTRAGVPNQLVVIQGGGHNLDFPTNTPPNLVFQILEFLNATWKDRGSQSLNP